MDQTTQEIPSKDQIVSMLNEQIEVKTLQVQLQKLNTEFAQQRLEELKAIAISAQITNPRPQNPYEGGGIPHTLTQEDMDNNPDLAEQGLKVGDEVLIPTGEEDTEKPAEKRSLKK